MPTKRIKTKVYGSTYSNPDGTHRQANIRKYCRPGVSLDLIPEPDNEYSDTAIGVWVATGIAGKSAQIGYVQDKGLAEDLGDLLDVGCSLSARILEVTGGGPGEDFGVNYEILVGEPDEDLEDDDKPAPPEIATGAAAKAKSGHREQYRRLQVATGSAAKAKSGRNKSQRVQAETNKAKAKSGIGCGGCLVLILFAFMALGLLVTLSKRKPGVAIQPPTPRIEAAPKLDPPLIETPDIPQKTGPPVVEEPPKPLIEEATEADLEPEPAEPPKPRRSARAATMLRSSRNIAKLGNREGAIASYRDVVIKFPDTIEAAEALAELKRLGGEPPSPEEIKPVE